MSLPAYALNSLSFPEMYERYLVGPLFAPWAGVLVRRVAAAPGDRVLDVACGTGIVARTARETVGAASPVVGVDLSAPMLAVARSVAPGIDWREGNATALPLHAGEQFDIVFCQQGLQFMPDKPAALAEMRRAMAPEGRLAIATWRSDDETPIFKELRAVAERHLGPIADMRHAFGDAEPLRAVIAGAGFTDVAVETMTDTVRVADAAAFARLNTMALVGLSAAAKALDEEERSRTVSDIIADSAPVLHPYADGAAMSFEIATNIATARR